MSDTSYYPYLGSGQIYAKIAGAAAGLVTLGNASKLEISVKDSNQRLKDMTKPGGGTYASVNRIDTVTVQMTLSDLNKTNVSRAVFGTESAVVGATVADEAVVGYKDALTPLAHPGATAVVVTNSAATTTFVEGVDYEVRAGGIFIFAAGAITDAQALKVDYTHAAYHAIEAMTKGAIELELHFEGLNEAHSGKPVIVDIYRALLSPTKALSLLGDKFAELQLEAEVLKDTSKTGVGVSQYFRAKLAD